MVPGYFAADGNAGQASSSLGNKWRVHFVPDRPRRWYYEVSFRFGPAIAIAEDPNKGKTVLLPRHQEFVCGTRYRQAPPDLRAKGTLRYVGKRHLQFAHTGEFFIKAGTDSPENLLAFADFDGTYDTEGLDCEGEARRCYRPFWHRLVQPTLWRLDPEGTVQSVRGPGVAHIGLPPCERDKDWVAVVVRLIQ